MVRLRKEKKVQNHFQRGSDGRHKMEGKTQDQRDKGLIMVRWGSVLQTFPFRQKGRKDRKPKIQKIFQSYAREASKKLEKKKGIESTAKSGERERE